MSDPTLVAGLIGAGGSVFGALAGTAIGYKLNNSKADISVYIDNRICIYYMKSHFCMYIPITVTNEGHSSATITKFEAILTSPTKQKWTLFWSNFAEENSHRGEGWSDGRAATPILVYGNSGIQHFIKLLGIGETSEKLSDIALVSGEYELKFSTFNRYDKVFDEKKYKFNIETEPQQILNQRRQDLEDYGSWWLPIKICHN